MGFLFILIGGEGLVRKVFKSFQLIANGDDKEREALPHLSGEKCDEAEIKLGRKLSLKSTKYN